MWKLSLTSHQAGGAKCGAGRGWHGRTSGTRMGTSQLSPDWMPIAKRIGLREQLVHKFGSLELSWFCCPVVFFVLPLSFGGVFVFAVIIVLSLPPEHAALPHLFVWLHQGCLAWICCL